MSLIPNIDCTIVKAGTFDVYGQPQLGEVIETRCSIVKLVSAREKTSVRADSSASRGNAVEIVADARLLFPVGSDIVNGDKVVVAGVSLRVDSVFPRHDIYGVLDHIQVDANIWA